MLLICEGEGRSSVHCVSDICVKLLIEGWPGIIIPNIFIIILESSNEAKRSILNEAKQVN